MTAVPARADAVTADLARLLRDRRRIPPCGRIALRAGLGLIRWARRLADHAEAADLAARTGACGGAQGARDRVGPRQRLAAARGPARIGETQRDRVPVGVQLARGASAPGVSDDVVRRVQANDGGLRGCYQHGRVSGSARPGAQGGWRLLVCAGMKRKPFRRQCHAFSRRRAAWRARERSGKAATDSLAIHKALC